MKRQRNGHFSLTILLDLSYLLEPYFPLRRITEKPPHSRPLTSDIANEHHIQAQLIVLTTQDSQIRLRSRYASLPRRHLHRIERKSCEPLPTHLIALYRKREQRWVDLLDGGPEAYFVLQHNAVSDSVSVMVVVGVWRLYMKEWVHWICNQGGGWVSTGSVTGELEFLMLVLQS